MPEIQHIAPYSISEIVVSYKALAAPKAAPGVQNLSAGDRAPGTWILPDGSASSRRLYRLLDPTRFTLLAVKRRQTAHEAQTHLQVVVQPDERLQTLIGTEIARNGLEGNVYVADLDRFYLIRPDGYLACVGFVHDVGEAEEFVKGLR